ncbi:hypothetical protein GX586_06375, partial [bacterium]|nr:hypothetical protein [bacterium]
MKMLAVLAALFCLCVPVPGNDTWTFTPRTDAFGTNALLDLRPLNERVAGEKGWMYAKDGKLYIPGSTTPFRGWSAGLRPFGFSYGRDELAYTARAYAKLGINQVREMSDANADVLPRPDAADITRVNRDVPGHFGVVHHAPVALNPPRAVCHVDSFGLHRGDQPVQLVQPVAVDAGDVGCIGSGQHVGIRVAHLA